MAKKKKSEEELLDESTIVQETSRFDVVNEEDYPKQMTVEEMMLDYIDNLEGKKGDAVKINDFFISLFTLPEALETSKMIKELLVKANNEKKINVVNNRHFDLGMTYYDNEEKANKYNIYNTEIFVEK